MNADNYDWLTRLVAEGLTHPETSNWERDFLRDQEKRLAEYGVDTFYTTKQWAVVDRIARKIDFEERPDASDQ